MNTTATAIAGVLIIESKIFSDDRGFFLESWNEKQFNRAVGEKIKFVQDNHSRSKKGVLRGLHYQDLPKNEDKFVCCIKGKVYDVVVNIQKNSKNFLKGRYKIEKLDSGHWLIQESFEEVSKSIIEHIN